MYFLGYRPTDLTSSFYGRSSMTASWLRNSSVNVTNGLWRALLLEQNVSLFELKKRMDGSTATMLTASSRSRRQTLITHLRARLLYLITVYQQCSLSNRQPKYRMAHPFACGEITLLHASAVGASRS